MIPLGKLKRLLLLALLVVFACEDEPELPYISCEWIVLLKNIDGTVLVSDGENFVYIDTTFSVLCHGITISSVNTPYDEYPIQTTVEYPDGVVNWIRDATYIHYYKNDNFYNWSETNSEEVKSFDLNSISYDEIYYEKR